MPEATLSDYDPFDENCPPPMLGMEDNNRLTVYAIRNKSGEWYAGNFLTNSWGKFLFSGCLFTDTGNSDIYKLAESLNADLWCAYVELRKI